ncbi:hypothetical protein EX30DRAFT_338338 [Ascodesmis nigricans]|uniref:Swiss Army Knife RNA repair protein HAD domain-containing protein n=1 Tax=Ascodesmis nigricans TaxID=341454 RepID=A0A4S2N3L2_9PEZI|nr:hypothetical protein EX30DRAFT_338338 [Ascodesmis nigricans]
MSHLVPAARLLLPPTRVPPFIALLPRLLPLSATLLSTSIPVSYHRLLRRRFASMSSFTIQPPATNPLHVWSILPSSHSLPTVSTVRAIHIYDFDNTLFLSPLPNPKIWHGPTLNNLQAISWLANGGWWHDSRILAATGAGVEIEEKRGWEGWWNESVVQLVRLSMEQKDVMTVLLTGRSVDGFGTLITRIVQSRGLKFDMVVLKPEQKKTLAFKSDFLKELLNYYEQAEEIRIYEDRIRHVQAFRDFLSSYAESTRGRRAPLTGTVIEVSEESRCLPPSIELSEVQTMINEHNALRLPHTSELRIKKTVFYTGYLLSNKSTAAVLNALSIPAQVGAESDVKLLGNSVLITPKPASQSVLHKTGPLGTKVEFEVEKVGCWDKRVWAAIVKPVDEKVRVYTDNPRPFLVLAVRRNAKPIDAAKIHAWVPPPKPNIRFTAVVGERLLLRIEEDFPHEGEFDSLFPRRRQRPENNTAGRYAYTDRDREIGRNNKRESDIAGSAVAAVDGSAGGYGRIGNGWRYDAYANRSDGLRYEDPDRPDPTPYGGQTKSLW